jgi:rare lipoprotein A
VVLFVLAGLLAAPAHAKPLAAGYGYGRTQGDPAPLLDLRGLLPPGPDAKPLLPSTKPAPSAPAAPDNQASLTSLTAACYDPVREGGQTASGEPYSPTVLSAAHSDMPLSSLALLTNVRNGREVIVRVNDRPAPGAGLEVSPAAAEALGADETCRAVVAVRRLGAAPYAAPGSRPYRQASPSPTPSPTPWPLAAHSGYLVQVGAFAQRANAEAAREQAASAGPASIEPAIVDGASLYRVRLGPWPSREDAEAARAAAEALGFAGAKITTP